MKKNINIIKIDICQNTKIENNCGQILFILKIL